MGAKCFIYSGLDLFDEQSSTGVPNAAGGTSSDDCFTARKDSLRGEMIIVRAQRMVGDTSDEGNRGYISYGDK